MGSVCVRVVASPGTAATVAVYGADAADRAVLAGTPQVVAGRDGAFGLPYAVLVDLAVSDTLQTAARQAVAWQQQPVGAFRAGELQVAVEPPVVMGVVNVTPDSFFDGGVAYDPTDPAPAIAAGMALSQQGATIVDVGGESTRPGATPVPVEVELARVLPVVSALADAGVCVSVDTMKAPVAAACVDAGARIVNDVSAGTFDPDMFPTVVERACGYVAMHMQGTPQTMQHNPSYTDVVADVFTFLHGRIDAFVTAGGARDRLVVDPGIGFGKRVDDNVALLTRLDELHALGCPVLVGVSQKSVLGAFTGKADPRERGAATVAAHALAVHAGAQIIRAHDVAACVDAVAVAVALRRNPPGMPEAKDGRWTR